MSDPLIQTPNTSVRATGDVVAWLMDGDPAIRWQTMRDLIDAPSDDWQAERHRTTNEGWGAKLLAFQALDNSWGGGVYAPKWTSTTYTLLTLCAIGIPDNHPAARKAAALVVDHQLGTTCSEGFDRNLAALDRCIVGMDLLIAAYFGIDNTRVTALVENLLSERMPDGAWNCRRLRTPKPHHSSFHTTFNVLEGLRQWLEVTPDHPLRNDVLAAEQQALAFMLDHRLFKSDKTGQIISERFTRLSYPHRWHYDVLRGLAHFARASCPRDNRLQDAVDLLYQRRQPDGRWPVQQKYAGKVFFDMEKTGSASRWNTLRSLRVLRWWDQGTHPY